MPFLFNELLYNSPFHVASRIVSKSRFNLLVNVVQLDLHLCRSSLLVKVSQIEFGLSRFRSKPFSIDIVLSLYSNPFCLKKSDLDFCSLFVISTASSSGFV